MTKCFVLAAALSLYSISASASPGTEWICRVTVGAQGQQAQRERYGRVHFDAVRFGAPTREAAEEGAFMGCYREPFIDDCYLDSCHEVPLGTYAGERTATKTKR